MKILVTGGAGYIGSHTIIELIEQGYDIVSIDNHCNSQPASFDRIEAITGKRIANYTIDLTDKGQVDDFFSKEKNFDGIIHFAALKAVGESIDLPLLYYQNNIGALINVLEAMKRENIQHIIFSSSCTVYDANSTPPVNEETPLGETASAYGFTKLVGERIIRDFVHANDQMHATILRYFNPVGAHPSGLNGESPNNIPNNLIPVVTQFASGIINQLEVFGNDYPTRDGSAIRDYVHVMDIANAHVLAIGHMLKSEHIEPYDIFNLGTGDGVSVLEIIAAFEAVSGLKLDFKEVGRRAGDMAAIFSDSSKAKKHLNWSTRFSLHEMMDSAWKWQQNLSKANGGDTVLP